MNVLSESGRVHEKNVDSEPLKLKSDWQETKKDRKNLLSDFEKIEQVVGVDRAKKLDLYDKIIFSCVAKAC